ncbi:MAG: AAA family ATPase [Candidatus Omnitrophota bacterium]|nr:MAG: AAA family ATPase [Candidatus Omnitrophota bacterium]
MAQYELNFRDYLRIFRKRKFIIILIVIAFIIGAGAYSRLQVPLYQAITTVKIEERKTIAGLLTEWIVYNPGDTMQTQAKIIKGFPIMQKVALRLKLTNKDSHPSDVQKVVRRITSQIETERIGQTNIIRITVTSVEPREAMVLANAVAHVYLEENLLEKNKQARTVRKFIEEQLSSLQERLRETEEKLLQYGETMRDVQIAGPIQSQLLELEFQLASLQQKYTSRHPKVIRLQHEIEKLKGRVKGFSQEELEYARLQREVEVNKRLYAMLKEKLEQARISEAEKVSDVSIIDPAVMPKSPLNPQSNFILLLGGLTGLIVGSVLALVFETLDTSIGTIEDVESIIKLPVLGVIPSIVSELERSKSFLQKTLRKVFPPKLTEEEKNYVRLIIHNKPTSYVSESFRNIRTNLKIGPSKKLFLITSSSPKEGKSVILINLGLAAAQEGMKVLLVSTDLRRPVLAKTFGMEREPGLTEVLLGTVPLGDVIRNIMDIIVGQMELDEALKPSGLRNIWVLPSGSLPSNPSEILASKQTTSLIDTIRKDFDAVFFDSPPILPVTDASILAPLVDAVILCYEIGRTSRDALLRAKSQLDSVKAHICGIILNHTNLQNAPLEPYPYYYRYKDRYYGKEEAEKKT